MFLFLYQTSFLSTILKEMVHQLLSLAHCPPIILVSRNDSCWFLFSKSAILSDLSYNDSIELKFIEGLKSARLWLQTTNNQFSLSLMFNNLFFLKLEEGPAFDIILTFQTFLHFQSFSLSFPFSPLLLPSFFLANLFLQAKSFKDSNYICVCWSCS